MISNRMFKFLAVLPLLLLVSCTANETSQSTQSTQSTQDKKTELCTNLARFKTSVATLKSMSPSSTVGDFRTAQDQVKTTFNDVKNSARNVQDAKAEDLERAYENLDKAVRDVPNTATLQQATASVSDEITAVETAEAQMQSGLNCP